MKKIIAIIVAALMLATGQARAGEWRYEYRQTVRPRNDNQWQHHRHHQPRRGDENLAAGIIGLALGVVILGLADEAAKREAARGGNNSFPPPPTSPRADCEKFVVVNGEMYCRR